MRLNQEKKFPPQADPPLAEKSRRPINEQQEIRDKRQGSWRAILDLIKLSIKKGGFLFFPSKHFARKVIILLIIFAWIFSGWAETLLAEEAILTTEPTTSEISEPIAGPGDEIISTSTFSENFVDSEMPEESASSTEELLLPEEPVKKQSLLAALFGAVWDLLFGEDNLSSTAETKDRVTAERISGDVRLAAVVRNSKAELWMEDTTKKEWQKIADEEMISESSPIGFQDNIILWLSPDQKAMVGLDILSQAYFSQSIEPRGNTVIEFNAKKYILLLQNNTIALVPHADETNEINF